MISNVTFAAHPRNFITNVVKASSNLNDGFNTSVTKDISNPLLDKFLNSKFYDFMPKRASIVKDLELDPMKSYMASHGLDIFI